MKVMVIYRPNSEYSRMTEEFLEQLNRDSSIKVQVIDCDSRDGIAMMQFYDIFDKPAILVTQDNGSLLNSWVGKNLPTINEVQAYAVG